MKMDYDSLNIYTKDHYRLTSWFCKSPDYKTKPIILVCGGDAGNMSYFLNFAYYAIHDLDYSVLLFDYRGFGSSQSFNIDTCELAYPQFQLDINAALDTAHNMATKYHVPLIVYGYSMGASLGLIAVSQRKDIKAIVAESPYAAQRFVCRNIHQLDSNKTCITYIKDPSLEPLMHTDIANSEMKIVILHASQDTHINSNDVMQLYAELKTENKYLFYSGKATHGYWTTDSPRMVLNIFRSL